MVVVFLVALGQGKGNGLSAGTALFNGDLFGWSLIFAAVGVAMLSFLGFDGISMLAEENREEARKIGRAMGGALIVAGVLFVLQTWLGSMLVPEPGRAAQRRPGRRRRVRARPPRRPAGTGCTC